MPVSLTALLIAAAACGESNGTTGSVAGSHDVAEAPAKTTSTGQSTERVANPQTAVVVTGRSAAAMIPIDLTGIEISQYEPFMTLEFGCRTYDNVAEFKMVAQGWDSRLALRVRSGDREIVLKRDANWHFSHTASFNSRHPENSEAVASWESLASILTAMSATGRITVSEDDTWEGREQFQVVLEDPDGLLANAASGCQRLARTSAARLTTPVRLEIRRIDGTNFEETVEEIGRHHGSTIALNVRISQSAGDTFVYRSGDLEVRTDNLILRTSRDLTRIGPDWGLTGRFVVSRERQGELTVVTLDPL